MLNLSFERQLVAALYSNNNSRSEIVLLNLGYVIFLFFNDGSVSIVKSLSLVYRKMFRLQTELVYAIISIWDRIFTVLKVSLPDIVV